MKVAITVKGRGLGCRVEPRFGRSPLFLVVETDHGACDFFDNSAGAEAASGAGVQTGRRIVELGVDAVLTGQVGPKALEVLRAANIRVYTGIEGTAQDALRTLEAGELEPIA